MSIKTVTKTTIEEAAQVEEDKELSQEELMAIYEATKQLWN